MPTELVATAEMVRELRGQVRAFGRANGASDRMVENIALAITEATTNVALHAYPRSRPGRLNMTCRVQDGCLVFVIRDYGVGPDQGQAHGLGLGYVVMRRLATSCRIEAARPGTRVTLGFSLDEASDEPTMPSWLG
jgi:anti-sigma regulatory factor (Ser/Thr protein kinase)